MSDSSTEEKRRIGRYEIVAEVGRGGMGVVYRAEDRMIGRDVAIKTLTDVTPELRERFYVEARSGILSHPNIVTVYELGDEDGTPFIAMEFLAGESLERLLHGGKKLPLLETLPITEQLCAGLGYAHQHGLVHRDVKPANVMVLPDGRVKIVDFGIARLADQATRLTRADALLGTFHYIAPERLKGEASDGRADIWSVGVMLYEMITGALPFRGRDVSALYRVMHEPYVPLRELVDNVPEALTAVLDRALAKQVGERYGSTEEMLVDLQKIGEGLKRERVEELLRSARRLMEERRFTNARTVVLQVQRIDVTNASARLLLQEVQEELSQLQRGEQLRQTVEQAEEAFAARQMDDALELYEQAAKLDQEGTFEIAGKIEAIRAAQEQARRVRSLWEQAGEARTRGDLTQAQLLLAEALHLDDRSTELRQAHAILLREIRRQEDTAKVAKLLRGAREEIAGRQYTAAITTLREAAEIDPTHEEVQQLLLAASGRQREERRRQALEQVVGGIQDSLDGDNLERARDQITRALNMLPTETTLLRLKAEIDRREREVQVEATVRSTALATQDLWEEEPEQALALVEAALAETAGEPRLVQMRARLEEHRQRRHRERLLERRLSQARLWLDQRRPADAVIELEAAAVEVGETEELRELRTLAREQQAEQERQKRRAAQVEDANRLLSEGRYAELLSRLTPGGDDGELKNLRETAERRLREIAERVQAVTASAAATAETDLAGALRLLGEQPNEVKHSPGVVSLCAELSRRLARQQAIAVAAQRSELLLLQGKLAASAKPMEQLARELGGEDAAVAAARATFEQRRRRTADDTLQEVLRSAQQALASGAAGEAQRGLARARVTAGFASETIRAELRRLEERAEAQHKQTKAAKPGMKQWTERARRGLEAVRLPTGRGGRAKREWVWGGAALIALTMGGGATVAIHSCGERPHERAVTVPAQSPAPPARQPAAQPPSTAAAVTPALPATAAASPAGTYLAVNAAPWATVVAVRDGTGKTVALPDGELATPLRVDGLAAGTYQVELRSAAGEQKQLQCGISATQHQCVGDFGVPNLGSVLKGARR